MPPIVPIDQDVAKRSSLVRSLLPPLWLHDRHQHAVSTLISSRSVLLVQPPNCFESVPLRTKLDDGQSFRLTGEAKQGVEVLRNALVDSTQRREGYVGVVGHAARNGTSPTD